MTPNPTTPAPTEALMSDIIKALTAYPFFMGGAKLKDGIDYLAEVLARHYAAAHPLPGQLLDVNAICDERDRLTTALAEAKELLREIRDNEVNACDEADKFLRDHVPSELSKAKARCEELEVYRLQAFELAHKFPLLTTRAETAEAQRDRMKAALEESSSLLAFLHGAFGNQLKPHDKQRLTTAHGANRAALSTPPAEEKP